MAQTKTRTKPRVTARTLAARASATTELRRVTRRITELQARQRELIQEVGLSDTTERVVLTALDLASDVNAFADKSGADGLETTARQRQRIVLAKKVSRAIDRIGKLPESDAKAAAMLSLTEAANRLLERFQVPA